MNFAICSPFVYGIGVWALQQNVRPIPTNEFFLRIRRWHNVVLSLASFAMLLLVVVGTVLNGKMHSLTAFLCMRMTNVLTVVGMHAFAWSKYYEWLDTLFLILGGKKLEALHLVHHGITPLIAFSQVDPDLAPNLTPKP